MYCIKCGNEVNQNGRYCPFCGNDISEYSRNAFSESAQSQFFSNDAYPITKTTGMFEVYKYVLKHYAAFEGRARRREFWMFALVNALIGLFLGIVMGASQVAYSSSESKVAMLAYGVASLIMFIYYLAVAVPSLAVACRRMHDINKKGTWILIQLVPFAGPIIYLFSTVRDSYNGDNMYGKYAKSGDANSSRV